MFICGSSVGFFPDQHDKGQAITLAPEPLYAPKARLLPHPQRPLVELGDGDTKGGWRVRTPRMVENGLNIGAATPLPHGGDSEPSSAIWYFDASPDGRWVVQVEAENRGDVWLLEAKEGSF